MKEKNFFRAWDGEQMHYWDSVTHKLADTITGTPYPKLFYLPMSALVGDSNDWVWMQYTGLKANGREIYEGDIIENDAEWWTVVFDEGKFMLEPINGGVWFDIAELAGSQETWVQGNIYENPELIKQ